MKIRHIFLWSGGIAMVLLVLLLPYVLYMWSGAGNPKLLELVRVPSPDATVDAVQAEHQGIMVDCDLKILLVPSGQNISFGKGEVFSAASSRDVRLNWIATNVLEIDYAGPNVCWFTNSWVNPLSAESHFTIELKEPNGETEQSSRPVPK